MFVKVCCIADVGEARLAIEAGASAIGLVSAMPSGPGPIGEPAIARIATAVAGRVETFLLTCLTAADAIAGQHGRCGTTAVQLVDAVPPAELQRLRSRLPGVRLVQVIHVCGPEALDEARTASPHVDALLLDSGNPLLAMKELGGTGRVHDWTTSRRIRESVPVPVLLAGGLTPRNAREAIERVQPAGLDVCSGLRTDGRLDADKLAAFFAAIHRERSIA